MPYVGRRTMRDNDRDSPEKCRERRRRRMHMRRRVSPPGAATSPTSESSSSVANPLQISNVVDFGSSSMAESFGQPSGPRINEPTFGTMSVAGRSREMEDGIAVYTSLCRPAINQWRPVHYFAVFDGHGGSHVADVCREMMHVFLEGELMRVGHHSDGASSSRNSGEYELRRKQLDRENRWEEKWRRVIQRSFNELDKTALAACACDGGLGSKHCKCSPIEMALGGSTAVIAVLTPEHIIVANCGDSRAVLCRGGMAIPLSFDHKPDRPDELARIQAAGGRVIYVNGARVEGFLAMSRAIGDKYLKPIVTAEPEVTFTEREAQDECLILASDGLWDVLSNELACGVALQCLRGGDPPAVPNVRPDIEDEEDTEELYPSRSKLAAALLTRLALGRMSFDNISVIVVDLKSG